MSRNLLTTVCYYCEHPVVMTGEPRPFDSVCYEEYRGMIARDAECPVCLAQYLAWVTPPTSHGRQTQPSACPTHYDLSFRSSFNDEPGDRDLPRYKVTTKVVYVRTGPFIDRPLQDLGEFKEPQP